MSVLQTVVQKTVQMTKKHHSPRKPRHGVAFARFGTVSTRTTATTVESVLELAAELAVERSERRLIQRSQRLKSRFAVALLAVSCRRKTLAAASSSSGMLSSCARPGRLIWNGRGSILGIWGAQEAVLMSAKF